jgi:hypothetical protein
MDGGKNKGRGEKIRCALFFNLIEVLFTFFCGALLCWLLLHKDLRNFQWPEKIARPAIVVSQIGRAD